MRLLKLNQGVNPATEDSHRYKMAGKIPNFLQTKRPVTPTPKREAQKKDPVMQTESLFETAKPSHINAGEPLADVPGVLSIGVFPKVHIPFAPVEQPKVSWFARVKNLFRRKQRPAVGAPVQTEWSLDRVTVVRNDLSDTDFEVVVAQAGIVPEKAKGKSLVGSAWKKAEVSVANPEPVDTLK